MVVDKLTVRDILEHLDIIIEYLTYNEACCSALDIALQLRDEIEETAYNDE